MPHGQIYEDITSYVPQGVECDSDGIIGGFPCQDSRLTDECVGCEGCWQVQVDVVSMCSGYCHQWSTARSGWDKVSARFPHISIGGFNQSVPCFLSSLIQYSSDFGNK